MWLRRRFQKLRNRDQICASISRALQADVGRLRDQLPPAGPCNGLKQVFAFRLGMRALNAGRFVTFAARAAGCGGTTSTAHGACRVTPSATLPMNTCFSPVRPGVSGPLRLLEPAATDPPLCVPFAHFHAHPAELFVKAAPAQKRPPFVKEDFHGAPHGHPTGDDQAFPKDDRQCSCALTQ